MIRPPARCAMRLLSVSDVVEPTLYRAFDPRRTSGVDLVLACGDLPPEYLAFLVHALGVPVYYVRGNHDLRYAEKPPAGAFDLHGRLVRVKGWRILGLEGSHWYNGGPQQYTEDQMRAQLWRLRPALWWRGGVDIVVTHAPPRGVGDAEDLCHRGFASFRWLIRKYRPAYFIHGHIHRSFTHPAERVTAVDGTRVVNAYGYCILDIEAASGAEARRASR